MSWTDKIKLITLGLVFMLFIYSGVMKYFDLQASYHPNNNFHIEVNSRQVCSKLQKDNEKYAECLKVAQISLEDAKEKCAGYMTVFEACKIENRDTCGTAKSNVNNCYNIVVTTDIGRHTF